MDLVYAFVRKFVVQIDPILAILDWGTSCWDQPNEHRHSILNDFVKYTPAKKGVATDKPRS